MNQKPDNEDYLTNCSIEELQKTINDIIKQEKKKIKKIHKKSKK